jgi:hypothetical protein
LSKSTPLIPQLRNRSFLAYLAAAVMTGLAVLMGQFTIVPAVPAICLGIVVGLSLGYSAAKNQIRQIEGGKFEQVSTAVLLVIIVVTSMVSVGLTLTTSSWINLPEAAAGFILLFLPSFTLAAAEMQIYDFNRWERTSQRELLVEEKGISRIIYASPPSHLQQNA